MHRKITKYSLYVVYTNIVKLTLSSKPKMFPYLSITNHKCNYIMIKVFSTSYIHLTRLVYLIEFEKYIHISEIVLFDITKPENKRLFLLSQL